MLSKINASECASVFLSNRYLLYVMHRIFMCALKKSLSFSKVVSEVQFTLMHGYAYIQNLMMEVPQGFVFGPQHFQTQCCTLLSANVSLCELISKTTGCQMKLRSLFTNSFFPFPENRSVTPFRRKCKARSKIFFNRWRRA